MERLQHADGIRPGKKKRAKCVFGKGCNTAMNKESLARHILMVHAKETVRCADCGLCFGRGGARAVAKAKARARAGKRGRDYLDITIAAVAPSPSLLSSPAIVDEGKVDGRASDPEDGSNIFVTDGVKKRTRHKVGFGVNGKAEKMAEVPVERTAGRQ